MELSVGTKVNLLNGGFVTIKKELGRGGQGIVYLVDLKGEQKALKWYLNMPSKDFCDNLKKNVQNGAPSDAFLWPEFITEEQNKSCGYVMKLRPKNYFEFGNFLLAKKSFKSIDAMFAAAVKICNGFKMLHRFGYSYQDLNDGNFFINPDDGDVLICDNDNVMPQGDKSGIMGKARYMAPEVVAGSDPDKYSDYFSLSVILFMLFYNNHPFEGAKVVKCPCMTESYEKRFYGSEALFIYNPKDESNLPVRGIHENVIRRWKIFPEKLKEAFIREFSEEVLKNPKRRMIESKWEELLSSLRDGLIICPHCGEETFVDKNNCNCMNCNKTIDITKKIEIGHRTLFLTPKTKLYIDYDNTPDVQVVLDENLMFLKNISQNKWTAETPSGKLKNVAVGEYVPIKNGIKISFGQTFKGEIKC